MVVIAIPYRRDKNVFLDNVQIVSRGFVYVKESKKLIMDVEKLVRKIIERNRKNPDIPAVRNQIEKDISKFLFKQTERNPIVLSVVLDV